MQQDLDFSTNGKVKPGENKHSTGVTSAFRTTSILLLLVKYMGLLTRGLPICKTTLVSSTESRYHNHLLTHNRLH